MIRAKSPGARDFSNQNCKWKGFVDEGIKAKNRWKSRIRSRVERSIGVIERVFEFRKVRSRGVEKEANRLYATAALANIFMLRYTCLGAIRPQ